MKKISLPFVVFMVWSIMGYFWLSNRYETSQKSTIVENPLDTISFPPVGNLIIGNTHYSKGIRVFKNNTLIEIPLEIGIFKDSLFNELNANQNTALLITGKYTQKIVDSLSNAAQGLARAEALKKELIAYGFNPLKIKTSSKEVLFKYTNGTFDNGISIDYNESKPLDNDITTLHRYTFNKIKGIEISKPLERYIYELKYFLTNNPKKKAQLTVFTDGDGTKVKNYWRGLDIATAFRKVLYKKYGIKKRQLISSSRGELNPLFDNNSTDKAKNNRLEIIIK